MSTLLVIQSYAGAAAQMNWSWPYYCRAGFDMLVTMPSDSTHHVPVPVRVRHLGPQGYLNERMIKNLVLTFEHLTRMPAYYSNFCVIEYDGIFLKAPPAHPGGLFTRLGGGPVPRAKAKQFFHTPWWVDRQTAEIIVEEGTRMIAEGEWELFSPDFFLGRIVDRRQIRWTEANTWSCNGNDFPNRKEQAAEAVKNGAFYVHGIRYKHELEWLVANTP